MNHGLSDEVRTRAKIGYVRPALASGKRQFSISVKELLRDLEAGGFPANHARQVCAALSSGKFLRESNLEIETIDGPPSKTSTTVVFHYRIAGTNGQSSNTQVAEPQEETPEARALRLTEKLRGLLKEELAGYGGGEAFLRWVRGYDEEDAT